MLLYIIGSVIIEFDRYNVDVLNHFAGKGISCTDVEISETGLSIRIPLYSVVKARRLLEECDVEYSISKVSGLPSLLYRYRKRWGLIAGMIFFIMIISVSGRYIWDFEIYGNNEISDEEILRGLEELGCTVGTKIKDIDFDILHNDFLINNKDIAWISVNMDGTVAKVELREVRRGREEINEIQNIVAADDGKIELISIYKGKQQVQIGDVVKKGDLLISGIETYRDEDTYYSGASGCIMATVNKRFTVEVDSEETEKRYTGESIARKKLNFFGFYVNLFINSGIPYAKYDTIIENRQIVLFDVIELPVWVETVTVSEYSEEVINLSEEAARAKATAQYRDKLKDIAEDSDILSIVSDHKFENGVYSIESNLYCITDIAEAKSIAVE